MEYRGICIETLQLGVETVYASHQDVEYKTSIHYG